MEFTCHICKNKFETELSRKTDFVIDHLVCHDCVNTMHRRFDECLEILTSNKPEIERPYKHTNFLDIALKVAERSSCMRSAYGAIAVKDGCMISSGYNGPRKGGDNCIDIGECAKEGLETRKGYDLCRATGCHAEQNCLVQCPSDIRGAIIYVAGFDRKSGSEKIDDSSLPCRMCSRQMKNAGIVGVYVRGTHNIPIYYDIDKLLETVSA